MFHDESLNRLLHVPKRVSQLSLQELQQCRFPDGQTIPSFEDLIELTTGKIRLLVELKADGLEQTVMEMIRGHQFGESAIIQSFKGRHISRCHEIEPSYHFGLCIGLAGARGPFSRVGGKWAYDRIVRPYPGDYVNVDWPLVTDEFIQVCNQHGKKVILGANSTEKYLDKLYSWQVVMINADDPGRIREVAAGAGPLIPSD